MEKKTLRIWHYWNGTHSRLTLRAGKPVTLYRCEDTEEGWSSEEDRILLQEDGTVTMESVCDGRDCDGRLTNESSFVMDGLIRVEYEQPPTAMMKKVGIDVSWCAMVPNWKRQSSSRFDEYAVAAGY